MKSSTVPAKTPQEYTTMTGASELISPSMKSRTNNCQEDDCLVFSFEETVEEGNVDTNADATNSNTKGDTAQMSCETQNLEIDNEEEEFQVEDEEEEEPN